MKLRILFAKLVAAVVLLLIIAVVALIFGGPTRPTPMQSVSNPFKDVDFSGLPPLDRYAARDGAQLAYRRYAADAGQAARGSVVLVHGSSANSQSLHPLAQSFAQAGFTVYALDIRGHGESGLRGDIAYVGQLEDDLEDFMHAVKAKGPRTLVGFSSGGGFAIRFAASARQAMFDNYLFLAPFISRHAASFRPEGGGWVSIGTPRIIVLTLLQRIGVTQFNHLPVLDFAVSDTPQSQLTPTYSYALATNFQPDADYRRDLQNIHQPAAVLEGQDDEVFISSRFAEVFADAGRRDIPVTLIPGVGHVGLTLDPVARAAVVSAVERLDIAK